MDGYYVSLSGLEPVVDVSPSTCLHPPHLTTKEAESNKAIRTEVKEQERKALLYDAHFVFCFAGITWSVSHRL